MMTHTPDWPGLTHQITVHTETRDRLDEGYVAAAIAAAYDRLEAANPGKVYREIGRDICQRTDMPNEPWQLFIGLQEEGR